MIIHLTDFKLTTIILLNDNLLFIFIFFLFLFLTYLHYLVSSMMINSTSFLLSKHVSYCAVKDFKFYLQVLILYYIVNQNKATNHKKFLFVSFVIGSGCLGSLSGFAVKSVVQNSLHTTSCQKAFKISGNVFLTNFLMLTFN
ncbi:Ribonuclease 3 [Frankliniella fusca]|uniref:Ribonuclease 3 n=1 Tax=Frankliniella fusca TaxID=407009 RepID=A0AAE1LNY5_9NEOP|nr:Ribonuclease 3 [Frankliniella fusca]